jgi:hypothetical protein
VTITFAPAFKAYLMVGNEALIRFSDEIIPDCIGTFKSARMKTRLSLIMKSEI